MANASDDITRARACARACVCVCVCVCVRRSAGKRKATRVDLSYRSRLSVRADMRDELTAPHSRIWGSDAMAAHSLALLTVGRSIVMLQARLLLDIATVELGK